MEKISGALLRYYRMQQNLSQEGLCTGICVVSYLSKIEQGKVDASEDILQALFARLQIHYHGDARFLSEMKQLFASFWEALDFNEPLEEHALKIRAHEKELLYSPLVIEYRLFQIYDKIMRIEETESSEVLLHSLQEIKVYENYMDELQLYRYHLLYDCFIAFWEHRTQINAPEAISVYLFRIMKHLCLKQIRRDSLLNNFSNINEVALRELELSYYTPECNILNDLYFKDLNEQYQEALDKLPKQCQNIFRMNRNEGMRSEEIAAALNLSVRTVENQLYKGLKQIKKSMQGYLPLLTILLIKNFLK